MRSVPMLIPFPKIPKCYCLLSLNIGLVGLSGALGVADLMWSCMCRCKSSFFQNPAPQIKHSSSTLSSLWSQKWASRRALVGNSLAQKRHVCLINLTAKSSTIFCLAASSSSARLTPTMNPGLRVRSSTMPVCWNEIIYNQQLKLNKIKYVRLFWS